MRFEDTPPANAFSLSNVPGVAVVVEKAVGTKCARSWKILPDVGDDPEYPDVSRRDAARYANGRNLLEAKNLTLSCRLRRSLQNQKISRRWFLRKPVRRR